MLKAITLYEPWASLMAIGAKVNETRSRNTLHRGDIAIHASKADHGTPADIVPAVIRAFQSRNTQPSLDSMGCILAVVDLFDVRPASDFCREVLPGQLIIEDWQILSSEEAAFGNYSDGRFIYRTRNLRRLARPVPCRGAQAIGWTVPAYAEEQVRKQL